MKISKLNSSLAICAIGFLFVVVSSAQARIPNFSEVEKSVLRGGRPDYQDLRYLARRGVKTILSLEIHSTVKKEKRQVEALGMRYISIPMSVYYAPSDRDMNKIVELMSDPSLQPIFVHCKHGEDRSGVAVGIYRVEVSGWSPEEAYQEMLDMNFHPRYEPLDDYFRNRTGYDRYLPY